MSLIPIDVWKKQIALRCHTSSQYLSFSLFTEKTPSSRIIDPSKSKMPNDVRVMATSNGAPTALEAELHALRLRNKVLTEALQAIQETADMEAKKNFELVWIARNRCKLHRNSWCRI